MKVNKMYLHSEYKGVLDRMSINKKDFCALLSKRLREERVRFNLKQSEIAAYCGLNVRSWGTYERALAVPDATVIANLVELGFDIIYLFTGERASTEALSADEQILLMKYRKANAGIKFGINNILDAQG